MADYLEVTLTITNTEEVSVPVTLTISWPQDMGYYALHAVQKLDDETLDMIGRGVLTQLIENGDASLLAKVPHLDDDNEQEEN